MDRRTDVEVATLRLRRGGLYFCSQVYERYFRGLTAVVLLRDGNDLLVMPVRHAAAGGYLLKLRNAAGDRVVNAMDFFREHGLPEDRALTLEARWSADHAALRATDAFMSAN